MEPALVTVWGVATAIVYGGVGRTLDLRPRRAALERAHDFYVLGWYGLMASGLSAAACGAVFWVGIDDFALLATLQLAIVLTFVLASAALIAAGASLLPRAVKLRPS